MNAAVIAGLLHALTPILIVWGAIFLFKTMEHTSPLETIRRCLNHLSRDRVAQVVLSGWFVPISHRRGERLRHAGRAR